MKGWEWGLREDRGVKYLHGTRLLETKPNKNKQKLECSLVMFMVVVVPH